MPLDGFSSYFNETSFQKDWAIKLTDMAENKHHIGDFLPPNELKKFMETYQVIINRRLFQYEFYLYMECFFLNSHSKKEKLPITRIIKILN